jgi:hypothetical protein
LRIAYAEGTTVVTFNAGTAQNLREDGVNGDHKTLLS